MKKIMISILLLFSILTFSCIEEERPTRESPAISVTFAEVETRDLPSSFTVSSEVVAYKRAYVASRITGLIEEVHFEEGQIVKEGDILSRIDVRMQQTRLRQARAALEETRDIRDRNELLYDRDVIAQSDLLTSRRNFEQAESEVEQLELEIEYGTVRAPISGMITSRLVEVGNNVSLNERMFTITDMDLLVIRPGVSEMILAGLEEGQSVEIQLDVYTETTFEGSIRRIFPSVDALTRLFTVEVEIHQDQENVVIRPGYLARIRFTADERRNILTVPTEAVTERDGKKVLFVLNEEENKALMIPVDIGVQQDGYAEILEGVEAGNKVITANLDALEEGTEVRVVGTFRRYGFRN